MSIGLADIFASVRLNLETGEFEAAAVKAADKTGTSMGKSMGSTLKRAFGGAAIGAALGQALNSTTAFADFEQRMNEVFTLLPDLSQDAMDQMSEDVKAFARETGNTTDKVIPGLYQAISAGVPKENVFDFLRVANKGAVTGVADLSAEVSLLSAVTKGFGDTSEEAVTKAADLAQLMVKLGQTTIPELAASYGKAVPLAAALGVSQDELAASSASLFGVTGNTAEVMTQQKAIFSALITQNPLMTKGLKEMGFETSALAIESLGLKGTLDGLVETTGGSTQALQGMLGSSEAVTAALALTGAQSETFASNLDAMAASAGTVDAGFERMDSGAGAAARKFAATMETMAISLGGFINKFGPLPLIIAQTFGPQLTRALGAGLGGLTGVLSRTLIPKVTAAILATGPGAVIASSTVGTAAGTAFGTAMGVAIPLALVAAVGVGIALAVKSAFLDPVLQAQTREIGASIDEQISSGIGDLEQSKRAIETGIAEINKVPLGGDQLRDLQTQLDAVNAEILARAAETGAGVPPAFADGTELTAGAAREAGEKVAIETGIGLVAGIMDLAGKAKAASLKIGAETALSIAAGITAARQAPLDAFDTLKEMLKNAMTPMGEVARLHGELTSKALARGLKSGDPAVRAQAQAVAKLAADRLGELAAGGGKAGKAAMAELNKGIRSKVHAVREASKAAKDAALAKLREAKAPAGRAGQAAGAAFVARLRSAVDKGDFKFDAYVSLKVPMRATGGPIASPSWVGEEGPELYVPSVAGRILSHEDSMAAVSGSGASGGQALTVNVYPGADTSLGTARRFGQAVLDTVAAGLREQTARQGRARA
jgi:TP901 family phage tail tape measure protein